MKDNQAYVITVQSDDNLRYLGGRDGIMVHLRNAVFYQNELLAKYELENVITRYAHSQNSFLNDKDKLAIRLVEMNLL
jgi:hypothetical protein